MDYNEWALYAQDQWHITRKITLTLDSASIMKVNGIRLMATD